MPSKLVIGSTLVTAALLLLTAGSALAQVADPRINARQAHQKDRITQGTATGELTRNEALRLADEQRAIKAQERRFKSDGVLTATERAKLKHAQKRASRNIVVQKHDAQRRLKSPAG